DLPGCSRAGAGVSSSASGGGRSPDGSPAARAPRPPGHSPWRPARETGRRASSLPAPQCFPRDLQLVGLATQRPLELTDLLPRLLLAGERGVPALQELLAPVVVERLCDLVLAADLLHRPVPAQARQHDLDLLLGGERPGFALLAQLHHSFG